ncbi:MAG: rod shape-determining protein MreC [Tannerella sp.]|jgi:rod shape-determining protein MreC|nr:rod shape-determining protein MreC [Tannerella sp.]
MQKLLAFILAKRHWLLFVFCEIVSFVLIYRNNNYQWNVMLSSANVITGNITSASTGVLSYLDLKKTNQELLESNGRMEMEIVRLREQINNMSVGNTSFGGVLLDDTSSIDGVLLNDYRYKAIPAGVINNSTLYMNNYITINKGYDDGIRPDMGVISPFGVVGIVMKTNNNYSVIISLLNVKLKINCKIRNTDFFGALSWKGGDVKYAYLEELPTHSTFQIGDTVVTSGYSAVFPPGIMVGIVESFDKQRNDNFYSLKVRLATDFYSLNALCVIDNETQQQQLEIEKEAKKND